MDGGQDAARRRALRQRLSSPDDQRPLDSHSGVGRAARITGTGARRDYEWPGSPATTSRSRRRARLRRAGLQHQQHGTGPGDHGGGRRGRRPGDHPGQPRRALLRQRHRAEAPDRRAGGDLSAHPDLHAPGPRQQRGHLRHRDPVRLHLRDDGRLAEGRRQDARPTTTTTSRVTSSVVDMAHWVGVSVEGELGVLGTSRPAWARRKTATASRASSATTSC